MRYEFGEHRLDTTTRELSSRQAPVHVSPKAYELLLLLIEQRPRVLNKQQLMDALWPGTFVGDANLHVLVAEIRAALGERSTRDSVIKTHHGVGYGFAADVRERRQRHAPAATASRAALVAGERRHLLVHGSNEIGRDPKCGVCLDEASVSRHHARIKVTDGSVVVEDLESKNGTFVNGKRIAAPRPLVNGDSIVFGSVRTTIAITRAPDLSTVSL